ncbi:protein of unknown function [Pseudomonas inefficax]|uniref:Uncharacterized protein n=1 Tax=Pseudomonas inefficax TaxID=2078786 RepID=A0AAQ1SW52_9PSED|nr:protein of unknown function [Pseudomonas inefficax]
MACAPSLAAGRPLCRQHAGGGQGLRRVLRCAQLQLLYPQAAGRLRLRPPGRTGQAGVGVRVPVRLARSRAVLAGAAGSGAGRRPWPGLRQLPQGGPGRADDRWRALVSVPRPAGQRPPARRRERPPRVGGDYRYAIPGVCRCRAQEQPAGHGPVAHPIGKASALAQADAVCCYVGAGVPANTGVAGASHRVEFFAGTPAPTRGCALPEAHTIHRDHLAQASLQNSQVLKQCTPFSELVVRRTAGADPGSL